MKVINILSIKQIKQVRQSQEQTKLFGFPLCNLANSLLELIGTIGEWMWRELKPNIELNGDILWPFKPPPPNFTYSYVNPKKF